MKMTALIMAGGRGERFWPMSRENCPKQFLSLTKDGETMIQKTVRRLLPLVAAEDIYILTNAAYLPLISEQLPELPPENVLSEPCPRNTAPCIGLAAGIIRQKYGDAVMFVLPSDHLICSEQVFRDTLCHAAYAAADGTRLVTLGIPPTYPETGYGYLRFAKGSGGIYNVEQFVEKPDAETAQAYLRSGSYLWNSGMFIWKASTILMNIERHLPELYAGLEPITAAWGTPEYERILAAQYGTLPDVSVDYGIMEKAEHICTIPGSFGWDDVGSWRALERIHPADGEGNVLNGDIVTVNSSGCTVSGAEKLIAVLGLQSIVIVDTPDALLVCSKDSTQDIKKLLAALRTRHREAVL